MKNLLRTDEKIVFGGVSQCEHYKKSLNAIASSGLSKLHSSSHDTPVNRLKFIQSFITDSLKYFNGVHDYCVSHSDRFTASDTMISIQNAVEEANAKIKAEILMNM